MSRTPMIARSWRTLIAAAAWAVSPALLAAQPVAGSTTPDDSAAASAAAVDTMATPTLAAPAPAGVAVARHHETAYVPTALNADTHVGVGQNLALVVVGAAGIVTGALVGGGAGTAIIVGGAAIGLYGLYRLVR
jgi:hypothetical protein